MKLIYIFLATLHTSISLQTYDQSAINCQSLPPNLDDNLTVLWDKLILHDIDRYSFLIFCPIIFFIQAIILKFYWDNPKIISKPGNIFFIIIGFQLCINIHYLATAIYYSVQGNDKSMPSSFPNFCAVNAILTSFLQTMHSQFLILFPLYIVYLLRSTLKKNSKSWNIIYLVLTITSIGITAFFYFQNILGLSIYGLCGITFMRNQSYWIQIPIASGSIIFLFLIAGLFTIKYFRKHMPNTYALRQKKYQENQMLMYYVIGQTLYLIAYLTIQIILIQNCRKKTPQTSVIPLITVYNLLRLSQNFYMLLVIFKNTLIRNNFKKYLKKMFLNQKDKSPTEKSISFSKRSQNDQNINELMLDIISQNNQIDILKISQIKTIISGIYIAYNQYYNLKEHSYQNLKEQISQQSIIEKRQVKKIYFNQKMIIQMNSQIMKQYIKDINLTSFGFLACKMIIHAPKIFQNMLQNDKLQNIYLSFNIQQNQNKMFDLVVEGQGGRSGQFFFFSKDNKYVLKTITQQQFVFLDNNMIYFYEHFKNNPHSLLAKIYGLFTFRGIQMQRTYHLILMKNILGCNKNQILRTYDLKGSKYDREVNKQQVCSNQLSGITLKDIDFLKMQKIIHVHNNKKQKLVDIIEADSLFLKSLNLIDYSFLVVKVQWPRQPQNYNFWNDYQRVQSFLDPQCYYHFGIIDYLQKWDLQKKGEKWWKNLLGKKDISAQNPKKYQQRYINFINEIFGVQKQKQREYNTQKIIRHEKQFEIIDLSRQLKSQYNNNNKYEDLDLNSSIMNEKQIVRKQKEKQQHFQLRTMYRQRQNSFKSDFSHNLKNLQSQINKLEQKQQ